MSPMLQQSVTQHQSDVEDHGHTSYSMLRVSMSLEQYSLACDSDTSYSIFHAQNTANDILYVHQISSSCMLPVIGMSVRHLLLTMIPT